MSEILIYQTPDKQTALEVQMDGDTVWLSLNQMAALFERDKSVISRHLKNVFVAGELEKNSVVAFFATTASDSKIYQVEYYNLDAIISVGYRINSKRGTQFRQWATQRLKDYLLQGYALNQRRLAELRRVVEIIEDTRTQGILHMGEAQGLLDILQRYAKSFILLNQFDSRRLSGGPCAENITYEIEYPEAKAAIAELKKALMARKEATELFGNEKDNSFQGILGAIVQTFGGQYLYPSIEAQAAHLLYFVIKNHPFNDGNKRIGAFLFVWFLEKNKYLLKKSGELKINDNTLVALALLVAQSDPADKELMIELVVHLINENW